MTSHGSLLLAPALLLCLFLSTGCPAGEEEPKSEITPAIVAAAGNEIYASKCAACHGNDGHGGMGPNLTVIDKKSDEVISLTILEGRTTKGMPAFQGQLSPQELTNLVAFIKSI